VGIFRYIVQGFGWEIGSQAAREGIDALKEQRAAAAPAPSKREQKRLDKERAKQAARARKEHEDLIAKNQARIEAELRALKKKADRG
jgi:hypothetical protein